MHTLVVGVCGVSVLLRALSLLSQERAAVGAGTCVGVTARQQVWWCASPEEQLACVPPCAATLEPKGCETGAGSTVPTLHS